MVVICGRNAKLAASLAARKWPLKMAGSGAHLVVMGRLHSKANKRTNVNGHVDVNRHVDVDGHVRCVRDCLFIEYPVHN